jgi:hypothetical protein
VRTSRTGSVPPYLGADLTDRYATRCRPIDVCGLEPTGNGEFKASFWQWFWDPAPKPLEVGPIAAELAAATCSMLDGPQGLARPGCSMRACDRKTAAAGKVPSERPDRSRLFGGFICSSLDLFTALHQRGLPISPARPGTGVGEVYPGAIWPVLAKCALPKKGTAAGSAARESLLRALGILCAKELGHDQLDAALAALVAAAAAGAIDSVNVTMVGDSLCVDDRGVIREGPMIVPIFTSSVAVESSRYRSAMSLATSRLLPVRERPVLAD